MSYLRRMNAYFFFFLKTAAYVACCALYFMAEKRSSILKSTVLYQFSLAMSRNSFKSRDEGIKRLKLNYRIILQSQNTSQYHILKM
ncbi:hypothetical protein EDC94DRAFT_606683 [Helicostylum pulchrum]|nr:hypothetical protein EDC94DRAFT_606683 [Helicostylum pulchrum]